MKSLHTAPAGGRPTVSRMESKTIRSKVRSRAGWRCQACGQRTRLGLHHVVRRSRGRLDLDRLIATCRFCPDQTDAPLAAGRLTVTPLGDAIVAGDSTPHVASCVTEPAYRRKRYRSVTLRRDEASCADSLAQPLQSSRTPASGPAGDLTVDGDARIWAHRTQSLASVPNSGYKKGTGRAASVGSHTIDPPREVADSST